MKKVLITSACLAVVGLAGCADVTAPPPPVDGGATLFSEVPLTCTDAPLVPGFSLGGTLVPGSYEPPIDLMGGDGSIAVAINSAETVAGRITVGGVSVAAFKRNLEPWTAIPGIPAAATFSSANAINEHGIVAGHAVTPSGVLAFTYDTGADTLEFLPLGSLGGAIGYAINGAGQVAGAVLDGGAVKAALWTPGTGWTILAGGSTAWAINDRGDVAGEIGTNGSGGAFRWIASAPNSAVGTFEAIGMPIDATAAVARGINDQGEIVGFAQLTVRRAFHWQNGTFTLIPLFGNKNNNQAYAINNAGLVAGYASRNTGEHEAFVWSSAMPADAPEPLAKLEGSCGSFGFGINECGQVVGSSIWQGTNFNRATQWGLCETPPAQPAIRIVKKTNGTDNNEPTGPVVTYGSVVTWTYHVTNTGDVPLTNVTVTDDVVPDAFISCNGGSNVIGDLDVGGTATCTAQGLAIEGQYVNTGTATGQYNGQTVTDSDIDHYFGVMPGGICEGGVTKLVVKFVGTGPVPYPNQVFGERRNPGSSQKLPGQPSVVGGETLYTFAVTSLGGLFDPVANGRLANNFRIFIDDQLVQDFHTSCSAPIYPGMRLGPAPIQFEIVEVYSRNGGLIGPH